MPDSLSDLVHRFAELRALVLGDAMLDVYTVGETRRLCPEAPAPIVDVRFRDQMPGGAANTALNLQSLGAQTTLLSVVGDDIEGHELSRLLNEHGVDIDSVLSDQHRRTLTKHRVMAEGHVLVRFDEGSTHTLSEEAEQRLLAMLRDQHAQSDVIVISDYEYGVLTDAVLELLVDLQAESSKPLIVDSKNLARYWSLRPTAVKPNCRQAQALCGLTFGATCRPQALLSQGPKLLEVTGADLVAVTLDRDGALLFAPDETPYRTFAQPAPQAATSGAGDTYLAALALAIAAGADLHAAGDIAAAAAAVVVSKPHTAGCRADELLRRLGEEPTEGERLAALLPVLDAYRRNGRRMVLTNGCFDILHRGHITYLQQAKALGDVLIVGVNADDTIRRLKGPERPINSLEDRLRVLGALGCIDHLVPFHEDTPIALVEAIRPDVFVKGGDYTRETLPEAEVVERHGGCVKILPLVANRSTTRVIKQICEVRSRSETAALVTAGSP